MRFHEPDWAGNAKVEAGDLDAGAPASCVNTSEEAIGARSINAKGSNEVVEPPSFSFDCFPWYAVLESVPVGELLIDFANRAATITRAAGMSNCGSRSRRTKVRKITPSKSVTRVTPSALEVMGIAGRSVDQMRGRSEDRCDGGHDNCGVKSKARIDAG